MMPTNNIIANLFITIYNNEVRRKRMCTVLPTSKYAKEVLKTLQRYKYIGDWEYVEDNRGGKFLIKLLSHITKCGAISPRFKVKKGEYAKWEQQYLPSYDRGILIVTTNQGVMSHHEAVNLGLGGLLVGYAY